MVQDRQQDEYKAVYDKAVKLLSMRMHTSGELERKLLQRKFQQTYITQVINRLIELKVLNDRQFAEIFLDNLIRYKTYGYYGLKMKLLQRGIANALAEELLDASLSIELELKIARRLADKKSQDKEKLMLALKRKGFRSQVISQIVKR